MYVLTAYIRILDLTFMCVHSHDVFSIEKAQHEHPCVAKTPSRRDRGVVKVVQNRNCGCIQLKRRTTMKISKISLIVLSLAIVMMAATDGTTGESTGGSTTTTCGTRGVVIPVSLSGGTPNIPTNCQKGRENNWVSSLVGSGVSTQALCNQAINPKSEFAKWDSATRGYIYPLIDYKNMSGCFCANDATTNKCWIFYDL